MAVDEGLGFASVSVFNPRSSGKCSRKRKMAKESADREIKKSEAEPAAKKCGSPPPPPPPLPLWRRRPAECRSVTREEIERFWRRKKIEEEEHFLAALKTAAMIRARRFSEEDHRKFEVVFKGDTEKNDDDVDGETKEKKCEEATDRSEEIRVGIKDWWTKSKYAYLNQPAIQSMDKPKRSSTYIPNTCLYKPPPPQLYSLIGFS